MCAVTVESLTGVVTVTNRSEQTSSSMGYAQYSTLGLLNTLKDSLMSV